MVGLTCQLLSGVVPRTQAFHEDASRRRLWIVLLSCVLVCYISGQLDMPFSKRHACTCTRHTYMTHTRVSHKAQHMYMCLHQT